jgi:hypothetical protein
MAGELPLPHRPCDLSLHPKELLGSTVLEHANAIGLFLRNPDDIEAITTGYRALRRSRGLWTAPIFSGPLIPLAGDDLIDAFLRRLSCDLMIVSGDDQLKQLEAMTSLWPAELTKPQVMATGFWFPDDSPRTAQPQTIACGASAKRNTNAHRSQRAIDSAFKTLGSRTIRVDRRSATGSPLELYTNMGH